MKKMLIIPLVFLIICFPLTVSAQTDASQIIEDAGGDSEIQIPQSLIAHSLSVISEAFSKSGKGIVAHCGGILALCVVAGIMSALKNSFPAFGVASEYITVLTVGSAVFSAVSGVTALAEQATLRFSQYLLTLMPVMTSMYVYGGSAGAGLTSATGMNLFCTVVSVICNTLLTPLVNMCLVLSLTSALPHCDGIHPVASGIKNLTASLTAFVFSLLGFAVSMQTIFEAAGDSYATRTVRFASGIFVPVIGGMVGEASRTVISAVGKAKSVIGLGGITALLTVMLPPVLAVVLYKLGILVCASAAKMLGCDRAARLLYDVNGIFGILFAVMLGSSLVSLLAFLVFVCTGNGL